MPLNTPWFLTRRTYIPCLLTALLFLQGCSQKFNDVNDTMKLAVFGEADTSMTSDDIQNLPYASIYARIDEGPQAFMVLALAEAKPTLEAMKEATGRTKTTPTSPALQLKWLSADKGMITTEYGRIVSTLNMPQGNLINSDSTESDPLRLGLHKATTPLTWQRTIDWQPGYHFGYQLNSQFTPQGEQIILINDKPVAVLHFIESVSIASLDTEYDNEFWVNPNNGQVLKSRQKLAPNLPYIDITLLKPFS